MGGVGRESEGESNERAMELSGIPISALLKIVSYMFVCMTYVCVCVVYILCPNI